MAPMATTDPIHEASEDVIGPEESTGSLFELSSRTAGETQPHDPPKEMERRFTGEKGKESGREIQDQVVILTDQGSQVLVPMRLLAHLDCD